MWAALPTGLGMALTAGWNGAPALSWCYNEAGKSEPRFAGCEWQGVPGSSQEDNGARGAMRISHRATLSFSTGI